MSGYENVSARMSSHARKNAHQLLGQVQEHRGRQMRRRTPGGWLCGTYRRIFALGGVKEKKVGKGAES